MHADIERFKKLNFSQKFFQNTNIMLNGLNLDEVSLDLGPNCFVIVSKERVKIKLWSLSFKWQYFKKNRFKWQYFEKNRFLFFSQYCHLNCFSKYCYLNCFSKYCYLKLFLKILSLKTCFSPMTRKSSLINVYCLNVI